MRRDAHVSRSSLDAANTIQNKAVDRAWKKFLLSIAAQIQLRLMVASSPDTIVRLA